MESSRSCFFFSWLNWLFCVEKNFQWQLRSGDPSGTYAAMPPSDSQASSWSTFVQGVGASCRWFYSETKLLVTVTSTQMVVKSKGIST